MILTRRYRFAASHRLHAPSLGENTNRELYGKCNNPYGHGHNYVLEVSVGGAVDKRSGRVTNPGRLDQYVQRCVLSIYDHKDLNADVPDFHDAVPTTENLAIAIRRRLESGWSDAMPGVELATIRIEETPRNSFEA
jgi:6-pyruvoyltetrahydropterin/6-carboxytetrahydropterin synthase